MSSADLQPVGRWAAAGSLHEVRDEADVELGAPAQTQDPLKLYVSQIGDGPLLTREEERALARRKDLGDEAAKRRLIEANLDRGHPLPSARTS